MSELECRPILRKLLRAGLTYKGDGLNRYLDSQADTPDWQTALIWDPELREKYWQAMVVLQRELVPQHISLQDLYIKLWELFKEVSLNSAEFQPTAKLDGRIKDFAVEVKKPLISYYAIYEINNIDIGERSFTLGNIEVFKLTEDNLRGYGLLQNGVLHILVRNWVGRIVATVEVSASEASGANVIGGVEIKRALDSLRLAVRREFIGRSSDSLFLWELGKSLVIAKEGNEKGYQFALFNNREVYPFIADISPTFERILDSKSIWSQILKSSLPQDIQRRVDRAVEWVSLAITESSIDHKLVHLCTALEVLLLPDHKVGTKGELIALRQVLTGRNTYENPTAILSLYKQRGDIIHSGYLNITTPYEYWYLLSCCLNVLRNIIQLSQENQQVFELKVLLAIVENEESLGEFIKDCEAGFHEGEGINNIMEAAKERSKQLNKE